LEPEPELELEPLYLNPLKDQLGPTGLTIGSSTSIQQPIRIEVSTRRIFGVIVSWCELLEGIAELGRIFGVIVSWC
jgi:hypothetical protein